MAGKAWSQPALYRAILRSTLRSCRRSRTPRLPCQRDRLQVLFLAAPVSVGPVGTWTFAPLERRSSRSSELRAVEVVWAVVWRGRGGGGGGRERNFSRAGRELRLPGSVLVEVPRDRGCEVLGLEVHPVSGSGPVRKRF